MMRASGGVDVGWSFLGACDSVRILYSLPGDCPRIMRILPAYPFAFVHSLLLCGPPHFTHTEGLLQYVLV